MKDPKDLMPYQRRGIQHLIRHPRNALHLDMGLGKTVTTLSAIAYLLARFFLRGILVIAPRRVAENVWAQEAAKWAHTRHLSVCLLRGKSKPRLLRELTQPHDIWVINYEAIPWLAQQVNALFLARGRPLPFDGLVLDEVTRVKNAKGKRISLFYDSDPTGFRLIDHFAFRVGLTGTPAPNGYIDLWGQYYALDDGQALGRDERAYHERYFREDPSTGRKHLAKGSRERIVARIAPITLSMRAEDYLQLPDYVYRDIWVDLPAKAREQYRSLEKTMFAEMDHGAVEVFNAASLAAKCRQLANGIFIDTEQKLVHQVHDAKLEALDECVEEAAGSPLLVAYVFRGDMERILARYRKRLKTAYLGPGVGDARGVEIVNEWSAGEVELLVTHHASAGHGLNLQHGGHQVVWFGLDWPLEGWLQLNGRLRRMGQQAQSVIVHRILSRATVDEAVLDRLAGKAEDQDDFRASVEALQRYRDKRRTR